MFFETTFVVIACYGFNLYPLTLICQSRIIPKSQQFQFNYAKFLYAINQEVKKVQSFKYLYSLIGVDVLFLQVSPFDDLSGGPENLLHVVLLTVQGSRIDV